MRSSKIDASVLLLVLIAVLVAAGIIFTLTFMRPDPLKESLTSESVVNTLFVIEDGVKDGTKPLCSYVLMYYPVTKRAAVFDIPGSIGLIIPRINRVDRMDTIYDSRRITPFANEIGKLLGMELSFSVVITLENLVKITDLIEGVELFIPIPVDEYIDGYIMFSAGLNRLDGDKAKTYISYELPEENTELANSRRQRFFIGLLKRLGEQNSYLKAPKTAAFFQSLLKTGTNQKIQMRLFDEFSNIDTSKINFQSVSGNIREVSGQNLVFPHWDGSLIKEIARQTMASLVQPDESTFGDRVFTVEVLNGTTVNGLAGRTAELYRGFGYEITAIGNAENTDYEKTVIIDRSGIEDMVKTFGDVIRCTNIVRAADNAAGTELDPGIQNFEHRTDLTLIIGKDFNGRYITE